MKGRFRWGILGPGRIATRFATDLQNLPDAAIIAVGSRSAERSGEFASRFRAERAYGSYAELVTDPDVDAIYVATPHPFHSEHTCLCLQHGKPVLCEKPMGINEHQVRQMVECARNHGIFLMEAMWTRFLPVTQQVRRWLQEARIGDVRMLSADFGFRTGWNPEGRLLNLDLAGGALLDVGVYTVAFASMVYGTPPEQVLAASSLGQTGVDEQTAMLFRHAGGALALLSCAVRTNTSQEARIQGTEGSIHIPSFWHATSAVLRVEGQEAVSTSGPVGYHYEAAELMACVKSGSRESAVMPLDESVSIAHTMQQVRALIGLRYPMEKIGE